MEHIANAPDNFYKELWKSIFGDTYQEKYLFGYQGHKLSVGGWDYPTYDITLAESVSINPKNPFALSHSFEVFNVPNDITVPLLVCYNSTIAELGINVSCCTFIDAGFKGNLTLEIMLYGKKSHDLPKGLPIVQVVAMPVMFPCELYKGKYQNQPKKPVGAR